MNTNKQDNFEKIHPLNIIIYFLLAGVTFLFLALVAAYIFSKPQWHWQQFGFPKTFFLSTLVMLCSSYTLKNTLVFYDTDNLKHLKNAIGLSFILGCIFLICQILGWYQLFKQGVYIAGTPDGSYLYLISALHAVHVLAGLFFLAFCLFKIYTQCTNSVQTLIYFTTPINRVYIKIISIYWHYVDILWAVLFVFFIIEHW